MSVGTEIIVNFLSCVKVSTKAVNKSENLYTVPSDKEPLRDH